MEAVNKAIYDAALDTPGAADRALRAMVRFGACFAPQPGDTATEADGAVTIRRASGEHVATMPRPIFDALASGRGTAESLRDARIVVPPATLARLQAAYTQAERRAAILKAAEGGSRKQRRAAMARARRA